MIERLRLERSGEYDPRILTSECGPVVLKTRSEWDEARDGISPEAKEEILELWRRVYAGKPPMICGWSSPCGGDSIVSNLQFVWDLDEALVHGKRGYGPHWKGEDFLVADTITRELIYAWRNLPEVEVLR